MKNHTFLLLIILLAIVTATPIPHVYSSTLTVTVFTDKTSYIIEESITVYGNLTYNGSPVQDWPVALEIQDAYHTPVVTRTPQTDTNGTYAVTFKLPTNAKLGTYTAYVSSSYKGETATNQTYIYVRRLIISGPHYTQFGVEYWIVELIEGKAARVVSNYY